ncbi:protoporphyrinogen/coproporphyrinogen oxidase [Microbacterium istanbulense]|uniref:FAD-dependent oxidoreductase n=1 Tax=Microbacterium istanbulense TaxID=3122049 RepID=A0ABU8LGG2_9MICO
MIEPPADLAARAARQRVIVIGGGIGGLVAARECAKVGMPVTLLEAGDELGGSIRTVELDGIRVDAGAESFATRGGHVRELIDALGVGDAVVSPAGGGAWLTGIPGTPDAPLPVGGILGIPANPFQPDVRRIIGWSGAWRAYLDRVRPVLTIGNAQSLGKLVASRMGARVRDRLVAPVTAGVYSAHPDDVDMDAAAPGLNAALTRAGSLSGGVAALRDEQQQAREGKAPGSAVQGLVGGMGVLIDALRADLATYGVDVRTDVRATRLTRDGDGWVVTAETLPEQDAAEQDAAELVTEEFTATAVIVATPEPVAHQLLDGHVGGPGGAGTAPEIELVTLVLDAPALDAAPRGSGVLTVPGSRIAKALTHSTAKWPWLRAAAGGRHVVRVSFGTQGEVAATAALDDDAAAALALAEASAMLGVRLEPHQLRAAYRARYTQAQPSSVIGAADRRRAARAAVAKVDGLAVVGAWVAGTGLAQVVPDAIAEGDRLRHALLWD